MADYTGPIGPTKEEWERWYHRFKDVAHMLHQRGYGMAVRSDDLSMATDMAERLVEDESWPHKWAPPILVRETYWDEINGKKIELPLKKGQIVGVRPSEVTNTAAQAFSEIVKSRKGFGRYRGLATPNRDGLTNPWRLSVDRIHVDDLEPDSPDHTLPDAGD